MSFSKEREERFQKYIKEYNELTKSTAAYMTWAKKNNGVLDEAGSHEARMKLYDEHLAKKAVEKKSPNSDGTTATP